MEKRKEGVAKDKEERVRRWKRDLSTVKEMTKKKKNARERESLQNKHRKKEQKRL